MRVFLAVAEELHFGRAAARLHMAQPPVSRAVRRLERDLGATLFERTSREVRLTTAGHALVKPAGEIIASAKQASALVRDAARNRERPVRIAYSGASTQRLIGRLACSINRLEPGIQIEFSGRSFAEPALELLLQHDVDIAIGRWDEIPNSISSHVIAQEELIVIVPSSHVLATVGSAQMSDFAPDPFVLLAPHPGAVLDDRLRRMERSGGFEIAVIHLAPDSWTAISLVSAGVGCSLTVSTVAETITDPQVRSVRLLNVVPPVELRMAWRGDARDSATQTVVALIDQLAQS
ncbi:LysR family transcriptional regulator [Subtercola frigoramans]